MVVIPENAHGFPSADKAEDSSDIGEGLRR